MPSLVFINKAVSKTKHALTKFVTDSVSVLMLNNFIRFGKFITELQQNHCFNRERDMN